jgi:hypothetical protein
MKTQRLIHTVLFALLVVLGACTQAPAPQTTPEEPTLSPQASTATICVVGGGCHPSLQAAIDAASAGSTIEIGAGIDTEAGIVISKNLTIRGQGASQSIVQAADTPRTAGNRVFLVNGGVTATLKDLTVRHGYIADGGGGIYNGGSLTLRRVTVSQNGTRDGQDYLSCSRNFCGDAGNASNGGGIYNNGSLTVLYSTVSDNFTGRGGNLVRTVACSDDFGCDDRGKNGGFGGGIYNNNNRTLVMSDSTLSGNSTGVAGTCSGPGCFGSGNAGAGGGFQASIQFAHLNNVTITNNRGRGGGGINHTGGGSASIVTLKNSIVAGNLNENGQPADCFSLGGIGIVSEGYNLVGSGTGCPAGGTGDLTTTNVSTVLNPTLANNGGATFTHALISGSAAINAGNPATSGSGGTACLQADQRAYVRPDRCDIGAFEFGGTPDTTPPDTSITANPTNPSNNPNPSFSFSGTDSGSGIEGFECYLDGTPWPSCDNPKVYSGLAESSHTLQVRAIDNANNKDATPTSYTWVIETIPPSVSLEQAPNQADPTTAGTIKFTATFSETVYGNILPEEIILSGTAGATTAVVSNTSDPYTYTITVTGMTTSGTVIASLPANVVTDAAGNGNTASTSTDNTVTFIFDTTPPVITPNVTGTLGNNDWYTSDVNVSWTVTDDESTVSSQTGCDATSVTTDTTGVTLKCEASSAGGTDSQSVTIKRDATSPVVAFGDRTAPNGAGWNNSDVTVNWSCSDATSGPVSASVSQTVNSEGANQSSTGTCEDNAGNSATDTQANLNIDKTAPTLNPVVSPNLVLLNGSASVVSNANDPLSGLASQSCGLIDTSSVGTNGVSCSATDTAGNSASASTNYQVVYNFTGFFSPVDNLPTLNQVKAGSAVPVKFSLGGNQGLNILASGSPSSQGISCSTSAPVDDIEETVTAGGSSLSYDVATNTYSYVWKTNKAWANTCRQLIVKFVDGTEHKANFKFK